jgi:hypothetical protein
MIGILEFYARKSDLPGPSDDNARSHRRVACLPTPLSWDTTIAAEQSGHPEEFKLTGGPLKLHYDPETRIPNRKKYGAGSLQLVVAVQVVGGGHVPTGLHEEIDVGEDRGVVHLQDIRRRVVEHERVSKDFLAGDITRALAEPA